MGEIVRGPWKRPPLEEQIRREAERLRSLVEEFNKQKKPKIKRKKTSA